MAIRKDITLSACRVQVNGVNYFGSVDSISDKNENVFNVSHTDMIVIGNGAKKIVTAMSNCVIFPNETVIQAGWINCEV
jgi:hypothetical protein